MRTEPTAEEMAAFFASRVYEEQHNALIVRRVDSRRLVIIFRGLGNYMHGVQPLVFLKESGLETDNLIWLRDPSRRGYLDGCSETLRDFEAMLVWLKAVVATYTQVREVVCIGISSGALAAIVAAQYLGAKCSLSFGPRLHSDELAWRVIGSSEAASDRPRPGSGSAPTLWERIVGLGYAGECWLRQRFGWPAREWVAPRLLAAAESECESMLRRLSSRSDTVHHVYYVPRNRTDRSFVLALQQRGVPFVEHIVRPVPHFPTSQPRWDHAVIQLLMFEGRLQETIAAAVAPRIS